MTSSTSVGFLHCLSMDTKNRIEIWAILLFKMVMDILMSVILISVGFAALLVIHVCIVWKALGGNYDNGGGGTKTMSNEDLKKLPCFEYKVGEAERGSVTTSTSSTPVDCVVCLENLRVGDKCRLLPNCNHSFHAQCIDSWLLTTPICPICRTNAKTGKVLKEASGVSSDVGIQVTQNTVLSQML